MKTSIILLFLAGIFTGCDWQRWAEIRGQLEQLPRYARWNGAKDDRRLVFLEPVLTVADLRDLGFRPVGASADRLSIKYRYRVAGRDRERDTEMIFLIEHGKVAAVIFPPELVDLLGRENVERLLKLAGGQSSPHAGLKSIRKSQVLPLIGDEKPGASPGRKLCIEFIPQERAGRALTLQLEENAAGDAYNKFSFDFRSWEKQHPAG